MVVLFSTQFPLKSSTSIEDFLEVSKNWIAQIPNSPFNQEDLVSLLDDKKMLSEGLYTLETARAHDKEHELIGFNYTKRNEEVGSWSCKVVGAKNTSTFWTSIVVDYTPVNASERIPELRRKPLIIGYLLRNLGSGRDGDLSVGEEPIYFSENNGEEFFIADMLTGKTKQIMPIVYLSRDFNNFHYANPEKLSLLLSGIANVLVEPSREFSLKLKDKTNSYNVFGGAIGIYWENNQGRNEGRFLFTPEKLKSLSITPEQAVYRRITESQALRFIPFRLNWECLKFFSIQDLIIQKIGTFKRAREKDKGIEEKLQEGISEIEKKQELIGKGLAEGKEELQALTELYEEALKIKDNILSQKDCEIEALEQRIREEQQDTSQKILVKPYMPEIYQGEFRTIAMDCILDGIRNLPYRCRRKQVLEEISSSTNLDSKTREEIEKKLKTSFKGYKTLKSPIRQVLNNLGFEIHEEGKHYKISMPGICNGLSVTFPKSASDHRAGESIASQILKTFF